MLQSFEKVFNPALIEKKESNLEVKNQTSKEGHQFDLFNIPGGGSTDSFLEKNNLSNTLHYYQLVDDSNGINLLVEKLLNQSAVSFDIQTISNDALNTKIIGISFAWSAGKGYYLIFPENKENVIDILMKLKLFFENTNIQFWLPTQSQNKNKNVFF